MMGCIVPFLCMFLLIIGISILALFTVLNIINPSLDLAIHNDGVHTVPFLGILLPIVCINIHWILLVHNVGY